MMEPAPKNPTTASQIAPASTAQGIEKPSADEARHVWDSIAGYWDEEMQAGRTWQRTLIQPAVDRLLELKTGEKILEVACGNGEYARAMAQQGAQVLATDFSAAMVERARAHAGDVEYRVADGTDLNQLLALGDSGSFDACVCNMALMDMTDIAPFAQASHTLLRAKGRLVFSIQHPAFNGGGSARVVEQVDDEHGVHFLHSVKVSSYIRPRIGKGVALRGQSAAQWYFDRPISVVLKTFFDHGFVLDGLEEPVFDPSHVNAESTTAVYAELPPVLVARLRK
jgi:SAM-dependent methyltransferase